MDQLPKMIHVTNTTLNNIKDKEPSIQTIDQEIETRVLTDQAIIPYYDSLGKETVPNLFPLPDVDWKPDGDTPASGYHNWYR